MPHQNYQRETEDEKTEELSFALFLVENERKSEAAYCLHFLESIDGPAFPGLQSLGGDGLDVGDDAFNGSGHEGSENKLPQLGMVVTLVKENCLFPQHPLFASRECRLEEMSLCDQHQLCSFRT